MQKNAKKMQPKDDLDLLNLDLDFNFDTPTDDFLADLDTMLDIDFEELDLILGDLNFDLDNLDFNLSDFDFNLDI